MDTAPLPTRPKPLVLCILDGWGYRPETQDNAVALARTPVWHRFLASYPHALVATSGEDVGLPKGQMGNSEVGHMNIGAGRILTQELPRIDAAVADGSLGTNPRLKQLVEALKKSGGACHLLGLVSPGGVHSHQDHLVALARVLDDAGVPVRIHTFLDGRDTPPQSALGFMEAFVTGLRNSRYFGIVAQALQSIGVSDYQVAMELQESLAVKEVVRQGQTVACLPRCAMVEELASGSLVILPLEAELAPLDVRCVYKAAPGAVERQVIAALRG